jgi:hypothetical protein
MRSFDLRYLALCLISLHPSYLTYTPKGFHSNLFTIRENSIHTPVTQRLRSDIPHYAIGLRWQKPARRMATGDE